MIGLERSSSTGSGAAAEEMEWTSRQISNDSWQLFTYNLGYWTAALPAKQTRTVAGDSGYAKEYEYNRSNVRQYGLPTRLIYYGGPGGGLQRYTEDLTYEFESNASFHTRYMLEYVRERNPGNLKSESTSFHSNGTPSSITRSGAGVSHTWNYSDPGSYANSYDISVILPGGADTETYTYEYGVLARIRRHGVDELVRGIGSSDSRINTETNLHGGTCIFSYDGIGRIIRIQPPGGFNTVSVSWSYDDVTIQQGGFAHHHDWDGVGRDLGFTESGDGVTLYWRKELDGEGRVYRENQGSTQPGHWFTYQLEGLGRPVVITDPAGKTTNLSYSGITKTVTNPNNHTWSYEYYHLPGLITSTTEPGGIITSHEYDGLGRLTRVIQGGGREQRFVWDGQDRLLSETHPETGAISYSYNARNNLAQTTWGQAATTYTYQNPGGSGANLLRQAATTGENSWLNETVDYTYDSQARLSSVAGSSGWNRYGITYNPLGAVTGETHWIWEAGTFGTNFGYDGNNLLNYIALPDGREIHYVNGGLNRPVQATFDGTPAVTGVQYGYGGRAAVINCGNGTYWSTAWHANGWTDWAGQFKDGTALYGVTYQYDQAGNITGTVGTAPYADGAYTYDALERLASATYQMADTPALRYDYEYDNYGNITRVRENSLEVFAPALNAANRIVSAGYLWDGRGNLLQRPRGVASTSFYWDGQNRPRDIYEGDKYHLACLYNERGQKVKQWELATDCFPADPSRAKAYIYAPDGRLLAEYGAGGECRKDYVHFGDRLLAEYDPLEDRLYYHTPDQINSVRLVTDEAGQVVYSALFGPYGGLIKTFVDQYLPDRLFSGKERDGITGLDDFGARHYAWEAGRFISVDPLLDVQKALEHPQSWNRYAYCSNNPINFFDPDGRENRKPGKTPPKEWPDLPENLAGKKPKWNKEGYWEGKGGKRLTWDDRSHGAGVDRGDGPQGGHWDDEKTGERWSADGSPIPYQISKPFPNWDCIPAHKPTKDELVKTAAGVGAAAILYWVISESTRILFPPRNLIPLP